MKVKKGQIIIITSGHWSEYGLEGIFRVNKAFDTNTILYEIHENFRIRDMNVSNLSNEYLKKVWDDFDKCGFEESSGIIKWLIDNGYLGKELNFSELNVSGKTPC